MRLIIYYNILTICGSLYRDPNNHHSLRASILPSEVIAYYLILFSRAMLRTVFLSKVARSLSTATTNPAGNLPKPDVLCRVVSVVASFRNAPKSVPTDAYFAADLGFDSLLRAQLADKLEEEFRVALPQIDNFPSVESVVEYYASHAKAR